MRDDNETWVGVAELAKSAGITRSTVSRRLAKFERLGLITIKVVDGRKTVDRLAYERACDTDLDGVQSNNAQGLSRRKGGRAKPALGAVTLLEAQAARTKFQAEILELRLAELRENLLPADKVAEAMAKAGGILARRLEAIPAHANDLAAVALKSGAPGLRIVLKELVRETRQKMALDMSLFAKEEDASGGQSDGAVN